MPNLSFDLFNEGVAKNVFAASSSIANTPLIDLDYLSKNLSKVF